MTKLKKMKLRLYGVIAFALVVGVFSSFKLVKAFSSEQAPQNLAESGGTIIVNNTYQAPTQESVEQGDAFIGAVSGPDLPNPSCQGDLCSWVVKATFTDATNTIVSIPVPFQKVTSTGAGAEVVLRYTGAGTDGQIAWTAATTSVKLARLNIKTGAATTYTILCGGASSSTTLPSVQLLSSGEIPTSSIGFVQNGVRQIDGGIVSGGPTSTIIIGSQTPYLNCKLTPFDMFQITMSTNTFDGEGTFIFERTR